MSDDRRLFSRVDFHAAVTLQIRSSRLQADLLDISLKGALISNIAGQSIQKGDFCRFELSLDQDTAVMKMDAVVVYATDKQLGLRFENADLESITHLRRLVELNTGDSALVQKELFFLAGSKVQE